MKKPHGLAGKGAGLRFLQDHVAHTGDDCLIWPMHRDDKGYGIVAVPKEMRRGKGGQRNATRVMCELVHGNPPTPKHKAALSCGNGHLGCVHPQHVSWKTASQLSRKGERHHNFHKHRRSWHKLTPDLVSQIKELKGTATLPVLSVRFNVARETIRRIHCGLTWTGDFQAKIARPDYGLPRALKRTTRVERAAVLTCWPYMRGRGDDAELIGTINEIVSRRFPDYARADICQDLLLAILEGETTLADLKNGSAACIKRYYKMHPGRFGQISLDAPMRGFENLPMIETVGADRGLWA